MPKVIINLEDVGSDEAGNLQLLVGVEFSEGIGKDILFPSHVVGLGLVNQSIVIMNDICPGAKVTPHFHMKIERK